MDQLLADETVDDGGAEDVLWPLTDWQGSVRHLAEYDAATNVTTIANEKFFDAFGNTTSETTPAVDSVFAWTGRFSDDDTGLQWNLNRWYDPSVGRWLSEDPIDVDPNLYRYVGNSPGMYTDPSGLQETYGPPVPGYLKTQAATGTRGGFVYLPGGGIRYVDPSVDPSIWSSQTSTGHGPVGAPATRPGVEAARAHTASERFWATVYDWTIGPFVSQAHVNERLGTWWGEAWGALCNFGKVVDAFRQEQDRFNRRVAESDPCTNVDDHANLRRLMQHDIVRKGTELPYAAMDTSNAAANTALLAVSGGEAVGSVATLAEAGISSALRRGGRAALEEVAPSSSSTAIASRFPANNGFMAEPTPTTLRPGTLIDRYGDPSGYYASPAGTPFPGRALPPEALQRPLNAYEVVKPIEGVNTGLAAPYYGQPGLAPQYEFSRPIQSYIDSGHLRPRP